MEMLELGIATVIAADGSYFPEDMTGSASPVMSDEAEPAIAMVQEYLFGTGLQEAAGGEGIAAQEMPAPRRSMKMRMNAPMDVTPAYAAAGYAAADEGNTEYRVFDISIAMTEEEESFYAGGFDVSVTLPEYVTGRDFHLYHLHDGLVQEINALTIDGTQPDEYGRQTAFGFAFNTDSFSTFVLSYTVDFHWNIDGEEYEYCLDGGDSVSLCELLEALRVTGEDTAPYRFIRDIAGVWFSDESLVKAVPITEGITVGALKEKYGLECEYSAEMTAAEREAADSRVFYAPDWALVSLRPFDTDEYLTVEMKGGECFRIYVTDGQIRRDYISASGDTYTITVTYGVEASVVHFAEEGIEVIEPEQSDAEGFRCQVTSFSVYGVVVGGGGSGTLPDNLNGQSVKIGSGSYYLTNDTDYLSGQTSELWKIKKTNDINSAAEYTFEATGTPGVYNIYTLVNGQKQYININRNDNNNAGVNQIQALRDGQEARTTSTQS